VVELAYDFGLVRTIDPIGQGVDGKGTAMQADQHLHAPRFLEICLRLERGGLNIAAHRGLPA
jgi:hypothetical protein